MPNRIDKIILDKPDVNLSNADNTSDVNKPISTAQAAALAAKVDKTTTVNGKTLSGNISITATDVGLGNVNNTSDANKPVSTAQAAALAAKVDKTTTVNGKPLSGNISITATDVGLGNVNNTSDANKPISTAQAAALASLQADIKKVTDLVPEYGGYTLRNKIINSDMSIWQRGTPSSSISSGNSKYAADRFLVYTEGSTITPYREVAGSGVPFRTCMAISGGASNTRVTIGQRIESINCDFVIGEQVTFSSYVKSPDRREVTLKLHSPNSTDAWSSGYSTIVSEARTIPAGEWARVSITIPVTDKMRDGVQAHVDFGAITSGVLYTSGWQLESSSRATQLERRPLTVELPLCQYYYMAQRFDFGISHAPVYGNATWASVNFSINVRNGARVSGSVSGQTNMNSTINPQLGATTNICVGASASEAYTGGSLNMLKISVGGGGLWYPIGW